MKARAGLQPQTLRRSDKRAHDNARLFAGNTRKRGVATKGSSEKKIVEEIPTVSSKVEGTPRFKFQADLPGIALLVLATGRSTKSSGHGFGQGDHRPYVRLQGPLAPANKVSIMAVAFH